MVRIKWILFLSELEQIQTMQSIYCFSFKEIVKLHSNMESESSKKMHFKVTEMGKASMNDNIRVTFLQRIHHGKLR